MKHSICAILSAALVFGSGCAQGDQEPAELATEYKNHVSFQLDSVEWVAGSDGSLSAIDEVITAEIGEEAGKRTFSLIAWNVKEGTSSSISLYSSDVGPDQTIQLDGVSGRASYTSKTSTAAKPEFLTSDAQHTGSMTITIIDTVSRRISGTFECTLGDRRVTNGKFNTRYSAPKAM